jgi:hypothetical protein
MSVWCSVDSDGRARSVDDASLRLIWIATTSNSRESQAVVTGRKTVDELGNGTIQACPGDFEAVAQRRGKAAMAGSALLWRLGRRQSDTVRLLAAKVGQSALALLGRPGSD